LLVLLHLQTRRKWTPVMLWFLVFNVFPVALQFNVNILMFIFTVYATMSEQLKYIVNKLNRNPFSKNFNLISFDSLSSEPLIQVNWFKVCT
jgi:hypothetical protein